ncbi:hypothetical protein B0H19DRAFT_1070243 [Mycena capillaripes]|nr:hypothetical protein B0H19DRAFT_1070243 [Mycena capillaripes]
MAMRKAEFDYALKGVDGGGPEVSGMRQVSSNAGDEWELTKPHVASLAGLRKVGAEFLSTAGDATRLSPRQGHVKVCGPEGKAINIDPMEYDMINITHLQREPNVIGREPREKT